MSDSLLNRNLLARISTITLVVTLLMYPFTKIFSFERFEPFYIVPCGIFALIGLYNFFQDPKRIIPKAFYFLLAFVILAVTYNVGYTIFGDYNHLYNGAVYIFLSFFFFALYYYINESISRFSKLFLITTGVCVLIYFLFFAMDGFVIGHNSTFMYNINQFSFWAFLSFVILEMITYTSSQIKWKRLTQAGLFLFVLGTLSRSATAGLVVFLLLNLLDGFKFKVVLLLIVLIVSLLVLICHPWLIQYSDLYDLYFRRYFESRELRGIDELIRWRGLSIVFENPQYLLLGAGEGNARRFGHGTWIHSSVLNICFSYGILGFGLLTSFIYSCWTRYINVWVILIPLIVSSLFTSMTHNLHLWIVFALLLFYRVEYDMNTVN